jgi:hypothetical protein
MSTKMKVIVTFDVPTDLVDEGTSAEIDASYDQVSAEATQRTDAMEAGLRDHGWTATFDVDIYGNSEVDFAEGNVDGR